MSLAGAITDEIGTDVPKVYQFYKINSVEVWIHNISYGSNYTGEVQGWNVFFAPWKLPPYTASGVTAKTRPNYLPGCV